MNSSSVQDCRTELLESYPGAKTNFDALDAHSVRTGPATLIVIKVGGGIIEDLELMQECIRAIGQLVGLGFYPVVIHGGGPQISQALESLDEDSTFRDGLRVTSPRAIGLVETALDSVNTALVRSFKDMGIPAQGLSDVFKAEPLDRDIYGEVGRVIGVEKNRIEDAVKELSVPIVSCIAHDRAGAPLNANGDDAAAELVAVLRPLEYVSFTPTGGVNSTDGGLIRHINAAQAEQLHVSGQLTGGMYKKVVEALRLVRSGVVEKILIVHPRHFIEELFSDDGYGTLITA